MGTSGYNWSSAVSGIRGQFLWLNSQNLVPSCSDSRGHGYQLRYLSE
ncbi:hypothetical protein [uncultured Rikenella sp.]|nr:hypothetical protein [uncultured Rikenella sp.]